MKNHVKLLFLVARVVLGAALFGWVAGRTGGWDLALPVLSSPRILLPVVAFSLVGGIVEAFRLMALLRSQGVSIKPGEAFRLVTAATTFNLCIPGGASGDLSKLFYLRAANNGKGWELATVVFVDRLVGLLSMLLTVGVLGFTSWSLVSGSLILLPLFGIAMFLVTGILVFAALCLSEKLPVRSFVQKLVTALPVRRQLGRVADAFFHFSNHRQALLLSLCFSLIGNMAAVGIFTVLGWELFPAAHAPTSALLSMLGMFANTITITPGGLGVGEAAFDGLFAEAGLHGGAAIIVIWRLGMLPLCLLGLIFYFFGLAITSPQAACVSEQNEAG